MTEEEKIFAGKMFDPRSEELRQIKHKAHETCRRYNTLDEYDPERQQLIRSFIGGIGKTFYFQGPIQINYGSHTFIGETSSPTSGSPSWTMPGCTSATMSASGPMYR